MNRYENLAESEQKIIERNEEWIPLYQQPGVPVGNAQIKLHILSMQGQLSHFISCRKEFDVTRMKNTSYVRAGWVVSRYKSVQYAF